MNKKILVCTLVLGVLLSACAQQNPQALNSGGGDNGIGLNPQGTNVAPGNNPNDSNGSIDNSGNVSPAGSANSTPGSEPGSKPPSGNTTGSGSTMHWIEYKDATFGYSLTYPNIYTPLKEPQDLTSIAKDLIGRFRLLEPSLAESAFADMEPPKFSIEIYSNTQGLSLSSWVNTSFPGGDMENVQVSGADCTKVTLKPVYFL